jgi:ATP-binding cassette subfamily F protein 3
MKQLSENGIEKPKEDFELSVIFKPKRESNKLVVFFDKVSKKFNENQIIRNFSLEIDKGERVALIGPNGSGKSTLINLILDKFKPTEGKVELGSNVDIGYLPQEHKQLNSELSPIKYLMNATKIDKTSAYKLAKRFLLSDEDIETSTNKLSSGQKSKILLASIMASGSNFIILDEPTNYLDIPSREALEEALISYKGTLLIISHDRYFLERINPTKIINLDN